MACHDASSWDSAPRWRPPSRCPTLRRRRLRAPSRRAEKPVLVWLEFQDCAGNTESFLRASRPSAAEVILDILSVDYHETIMAAAGNQAEANRDNAVKERAGRYIAVVEGSIPTGANGAYCTIGGRVGASTSRARSCGNAAATIAIGTCAAFGGIPAAAPNPTGALGVADAVPGVKNLINLSACPANVENLTALLVHYLTFKTWPPLDQLPPAAVRVRQVDPRQLRAARALRRRPVRRSVGRRRAPRRATASTRWAAKARSHSRTVPTSAGTAARTGRSAAAIRASAAPSRTSGIAMTPFYQHLPGVPGFGAASNIDTIGLAAVAGVGAAFAGHGLIQIMKRVGDKDGAGPTAAAKREDVMSRVIVDPVTRIEGHLRIEAEVDGGAVRDAWSSSTMFRGIELILKGRDPRDAWAFAQRICGVCTTVHAIASIRAVENAIGAVPPPNARLLRNLIIGAQCVQDHVVHFYHLHALDWVDIVSALSADPAQDLVARRVDLRLAAVEPEVLRRRARSRQGVRRSRPARAVRERLLGPPRLPAAAGSQPDGCGALPRSARLAARVHQAARRPRRQEPASAELPRRRHGDADRSEQPGGAQRGHDRAS